jgi:hypothetical protein
LLEERSATLRAGAKNVGAKAISCAQEIVQSLLDSAQSLLRGKALNEVMRLRGEYVQSKMRSLTEQACEVGEIMSRAATEAVKSIIWSRKRHIYQILVG